MKSSLYILFFLALQQTSYSTSCLYLAPSLPQEPQDPDLLQCGRPSLKRSAGQSPPKSQARSEHPSRRARRRQCRAATESVQVDFGSQGPPRALGASGLGARRLRQSKVKRQDFITAQCRGAAFPSGSKKRYRHSRTLQHLYPL
jgi:hypothetical protein